jgi:hypothetical protein
LKIESLKFKVESLRVRGWDLGFRVQGFGSRAGFMVQGPVFRVKGSGLRV